MIWWVLAALVVAIDLAFLIAVWIFAGRPGEASARMLDQINSDRNEP